MSRVLTKLAVFLSLALALTLAPALVMPVHASMVLSNVILHFEPGQATRQDIDIENTGDEKMYIEVRPHLVNNPGTATEKRQYIADPREAGLLVTPNRLVLPPHGRKLIRFVDLRPNSQQERVYRVAVTPVAGELEAQASGLKILVGYEVLVLAQPAEPAPELIGERNGQTMLFRNTGNTNILLREGRQCPEKYDSVEDCAQLGAKRLYPGNDWAVDLPYDRPLEYYIGVGTRSSVETWR